MSDALRIPASIDAISAAWLSQAVSTRYPNSITQSVEILDAHSGTTGRVRLRAAWNDESEAPKSLFGKLAPTDPLSRQFVAMTDMGRREARFYAELAAEVPVRLPRPIWSGWSGDDEKQYFMLFEDLSQANCRFPTAQDDNASDSAEGMIDTLAKLHGHYWQSERFSNDLSWIEAPMRSEFGPLLVEQAIEKFSDRMPQEFHELATLYLDHTEALCDLLDSGPETLIHGDSHVGNTFLDRDEVGLLDWACVCRAPGIRDVSYFLCNSVSTEFRRQREMKLLARYLTKLEESGGVATTFEEARRQYRRLATCSWIAATVTAAAGSRMQSIEVGLRAMTRATQAIIDLGTAGLLRYELGV